MITDYQSGADRIVPYIPVRVTSSSGRANIPNLADIKYSLEMEAEAFIAQRAQEDEDYRIDAMQRREQADLNKSKPRQPAGLKKLGQMDAAIRKVVEVKTEG